MNQASPTNEERQRRWRLILGGQDGGATGSPLKGDDAQMDMALSSLYEQDPEAKDRARTGDLSSSSPKVARWLGDIRKYFPTSVVSVMQKDALDRLKLKSMLTEPELLETLTPDVNLVATLAALSSAIPARSKETARIVVRKVTEELMARLANPMRQAVHGALNRASRNNRPRISEIDWKRTIEKNLKHYQKDLHTIIPEKAIGFSRKRSSLKDIILLVDQSGSMATSVVYASIFAAVLAGLSAVRTRLVVFDTAVVDLTDKLEDPVDIIFGTQLGGGTDINQALAYSQRLVERPEETVMVLISDLFEGGNREDLKSRLKSICACGVNLVVLLALNDDGAPAYDRDLAAYLAALDVPSFASTPDLFPELMALALRRGDIHAWAAARGIVC